MDIRADTGYDFLDFERREHPTYWLRFWSEPAVRDSAWIATTYVVSGARDIHEVISWAQSQGGLFELAVEAEDSAGNRFLVSVAGYYLARAVGSRPAEFVSDPSELAAWESARGDDDVEGSQSSG